MPKKFKILSSAVILSLCCGSYAANLVQVYKEALVNDPTYRKAQADWLVAKQNFPLALTGNGTAGTGVLPNVTVTGSINENYVRQSNVRGVSSGSFDTNGYQISLTQPIFNLSTWLSISSARYSVRAATATYLAAAEDLMNRVAVAYFEVLRANDKLKLTLAQQNQFKHQLDTAEQKFKVGLIAITGVYDAQASYDRSVADEIRDRNELQDRVEDLRAITGRKYPVLAGLKPRIPLVVPRPRSILSWVRVSLHQNYTIQADLNNMFTARQNVKVAATAKVPSLNLTASYQDGTTTSLRPPPLSGALPHTRTRQGIVGGALNFPLLRGGFDIVNTRQARYQYLSANDQLQIDYRTVENNTRQAYLGIESGISEIQADQQAIISARNQLEATKAGYIVGTRTMVDVLDSVTQLTQTQLSYADDRYNYVEGIFNLKQQAGTLAPQDIHRINSWLGKNIRFSLKQPIVKMRKGTQQDLPKVDADLLEINRPELTNPVGEDGAKPAAKPPLTEDTTKRSDVKIDAEPKDKLIQPNVGKKLQSTDSMSLDSLPKPKTESIKPKKKDAVSTPSSLDKLESQLPEPSTSSKIQTKPIDAKTKQQLLTKHEYAIQLYSTADKQAAENYYKAHKTNYPLKMNTFKKDGQTHYRVSLGKYNSMSEALIELHKLPKSMKEHLPEIVKTSK